MGTVSVQYNVAIRFGVSESDNVNKPLENI